MLVQHAVHVLTYGIRPEPTVLQTISAQCSVVVLPRARLDSVSDHESPLGGHSDDTQRPRLGPTTHIRLTATAYLRVTHGDAASGTLRSVSWIDPAFTNVNPLGFPVNDDHPPADIKDGQDLVLAVYDALAASPQWDRPRDNVLVEP